MALPAPKRSRLREAHVEESDGSTFLTAFEAALCAHRRPRARRRVDPAVTLFARVIRRLPAVQLQSIAGVFLILAGITGLAYPLLSTALGDHVPDDGRLVMQEGTQGAGASLLQESFAAPRYFQGTSPPVSPPRKGVPARREDEDAPMPLIPAASDVDTDLSLTQAYGQAARVASARQVPLWDVRTLITAHAQEHAPGITGEPRVSVLELNLALDELAALRTAQLTPGPCSAGHRCIRHN